MIRRVSFTNEYIAKRMTPIPNIGLISISSPSSKFTLCELKPGWEHVLHLRFYDIDKDQGPWKTISIHQVEMLVRWIEELQGEVDGVLVHCEAGISRSAAVAKFISDAYGADLKKAHPLYNRGIYAKLIEVYISLICLRRKENPIVPYG